MQYPVSFIKRIQAHKGDFNPKYNYPHFARMRHKRPSISFDSLKNTSRSLEFSSMDDIRSFINDKNIWYIYIYIITINLYESYIIINYPLLIRCDIFEAIWGEIRHFLPREQKKSHNQSLRHFFIICKSFPLKYMVIFRLLRHTYIFVLSS